MPHLVGGVLEAVRFARTQSALSKQTSGFPSLDCDPWRASRILLKGGAAQSIIISALKSSGMPGSAGVLAQLQSKTAATAAGSTIVGSLRAKITCCYTVTGVRGSNILCCLLC